MCVSVLTFSYFHKLIFNAYLPLPVIKTKEETPFQLTSHI